MADVPLITVVTPTWQRNDVLLSRCIPSVAAQDYPAVEHVVVSDGPDEALAARMPETVRYAQLGEHDPGCRWGSWARLHGTGIAKGDYIAYLDDDNAFRENHLSAVIAAMQEADADFGYSVALFQGHGQPYPVGAQPPSYAQIDTSVIVHRRELLDRATWRYAPGQQTIDWDLVERWLTAGARWAFVPYVTVDYYFSA